MVKETIDVIKSAEAKAEQILSDAQEQKKAIIAKAYADAGLLKEEKAKAAKNMADNEFSQLEKQMEQSIQEFDGKVNKEISALRQMAASKERTAINAVITQMF